MSEIKNHNISTLSDKIIPINKPVIDSLKLRLPLSECYDLSPQLTSLTSILIQDTGEIVNEDSPPQPIQIVIDGVTFRFSVKHNVTYSKALRRNVQKSFLYVVLTSKYKILNLVCSVGGVPTSGSNSV